MKSGYLFWLCIGAGLVAAVILIGLSARLTSVSPPEPEAPAQAPADLSPTRAALQRCGLQAQPDDACRKLWADNRRHFLGLDSASSSSGGQP